MEDEHTHGAMVWDRRHCLLVKKLKIVKYNHDKVLYNVTLPETNHVLGHHLKLDAWVEHIGQTIKAGHYVLIRRMGDGFVKISDDKISSSNKKCIQTLTASELEFVL